MQEEPARQMPAPEAGGLCWQLTRPCVLTPRQLLASYAVLVAASTLVALACSVLGWWVVAVYCALEVLAAGVLYLIYMAHAVDGERITLTPGGQLTVELARGLRQRRVAMNPAWTHLEHSSDGQRETLWLCCGPTRVEVASQLGPLHKQRVESELRRALAAPQHGQDQSRPQVASVKADHDLLLIK